MKSYSQVCYEALREAVIRDCDNPPMPTWDELGVKGQAHWYHATGRLSEEMHQFNEDWRKFGYEAAVKLAEQRESVA